MERHTALSYVGRKAREGESEGYTRKDGRKRGGREERNGGSRVSYSYKRLTFKYSRLIQAIQICEPCDVIQGRRTGRVGKIRALASKKREITSSNTSYARMEAGDMNRRG